MKFDLLEFKKRFRVFGAGINSPQMDTFNARSENPVEPYSPDGRLFWDIESHPLGYVVRALPGTKPAFSVRSVLVGADEVRKAFILPDQPQQAQVKK